jgi:uncharacterized protein with HEPN domain
MDQHNDLIYIKHVNDAIGKLNKYVGNLDEKSFIEDGLLQDGVIRQLEIIGEAFRKISLEFRAKYQEVLWEDIIGMRSKLIHDYFGVDLKRVWLAVKQDIPVLEKQMEKILDEN